MESPLGLSLGGGAIAVLLLVSAFLSGAETALTAANRARLRQQGSEGDARAATADRLREDKERLVRSILLGNTIATVLAAALATSLLLGIAGDAAVPLVVLGLTLLLLVFGEALPKTYALHHADRLAPLLAPAVSRVVAVLAPLSSFAALVTGGFLRLCGMKVDRVAMTDPTDELRGAIELHGGEQEEEEIRAERAMLRSILDLADVEVSEIMTHRRKVVAIDVGQPEEAIVAQVLDSPYTRLPLWQDDPDNIVGVLHAKDLLRALQGRGGRVEGLDIRAIATRPWFIPDTTTLLDQLQAFRARREHFALVVDEYGSLQGVVTLEDILEEIVGDISDEHDVPVAGVRPQSNGSYLIDGTVTIRDLNRQFEWRLPDDRASTLAGLVLYEVRRIPTVGQVFTFYGFRFEILRRQRNQITLVRVTPPAAGGEDAPASGPAA